MKAQTWLNRLLLKLQYEIFGAIKTFWVEVPPKVDRNRQLIDMLIIIFRSCLPVGHIGLTTITFQDWVETFDTSVPNMSATVKYESRK